MTKRTFPLTDEQYEEIAQEIEVLVVMKSMLDDAFEQLSRSCAKARRKMWGKIYKLVGEVPDTRQLHLDRINRCIEVYDLAPPEPDDGE